MLNSLEHEISTAHKTDTLKKSGFFLHLKLSDVVFILLINVKMPTIITVEPVLSGHSKEDSKICFEDR